MPFKTDLNKLIGDKKTKGFSRPVILFFLIISTSIFSYLVFNGKHNKLPGGIETNIPYDSSNKKDTATIINDNRKEINIKNNRGDIIVK